MAVAHDAVSESHTGTTSSVSEASFTWNHDPVGTPRGVLVFVFNTNSPDPQAVAAVTYDGVAVPFAGAFARDSIGAEQQSVYAFFLGRDVPTTDPAAVVVTRPNNAGQWYAVAITVTAAADTQIPGGRAGNGIVLLEEDGTLAEQSVDDGSTGVDSMRYAAVGSGLAAVPSPGANSTALADIDYGAQVCAVVRETTAGQGARSVGFSDGTTDDRAAIHVAIREVADRLDNLGQLGKTTDKVSGTTVVVTALRDAPVGSLIEVKTTWDNTATVDGASTNLSCADSAGNSYTKIAEHTNSVAGVAADGATAAAFYTVVTSELSVGGTITVTSDTARTAKNATAWLYSRDTTKTITVEQVVTGLGDLTAPPTLTLTGMASREYLLSYVAAYESDAIWWFEDVDYIDQFMVWTPGGGAQTNMALFPAFRIATLTDDTFTPDRAPSPATADNVAILYAIYEAGAEAPSDALGYQRLYGPAQLGTSAADIYTVPENVRTRIRHIYANNPSGSPVDFTLSVGTDAASTRLYDSYNVPAGEPLDWRYDHALVAGEKIQAYAGTGSTLVLTVDGYVESD